MKYLLRKLFKVILGLVLVVIAVCALIISYSKLGIETETTREAAPSGTQFAVLQDGGEIAYQEVSNNASTTILFIGGLSGWSGTWKRTIAELEENLEQATSSKYNFIAIDLPPFGFSQVGSSGLYDGVFFRDIQAKRVNDFREGLGLESVIFVAHSYGAGIAAEAVMNNSEGVEKFVIIDGVLNIDQPKIVKENILTKYPIVARSLMHLVTHIQPVIKKQLGSFVFQKSHIDADLAELYSRSFVVDGNSEKFAQWIHDYTLDPLHYKSTQGSEYQKLTMPVRVIWGKEDTLTPLVLAHELMEKISDGKLYVLENVGHVPMIEDYQQFDTALVGAIIE